MTTGLSPQRVVTGLPWHRGKASARHLLSLRDIGPENLSLLVDRSLEFATHGVGVPPLIGKTVGIYFKRTSTRTRTAFTVATIKLGATPIAYGPNELQICTGETIQDTARVLAGYLDALVVRTNESIDEMRAFASQNEMAIVNAMSDTEHPTQAIADLVTIKEAFGRLHDIDVLYVGEGNNTAAALAFATALTPGMRLTLLTPAGYGLESNVLETARGLSLQNGSVVEERHDVSGVQGKFDVVYTTRWQTMGVSKPDRDWKEKFKSYCVTPELMQRFSKSESSIFMHDLPAVRGEDVVDEVLDGPQSLAFRQARHKLTSAMAVLAWCINDY
jgi:ornithine carbamoyltransferase